MNLAQRLRARIEADGPIPFDAFVEAALYDPDEGFYTRSTPGAVGDFITSPHISEAFGMLVANQIRESWRALDEPASLDVVELGAGDGTLAAQIVETAGSDPALARALRYTAVERSARGREVLTARAIALADDVPAEIDGCVLANELLDNLPFRLFRRAPGADPVEVFVGLDGDRFVEVERPSAGVEIAEGDERPVCEAMGELVARVARALRRGYAFFIDYGFAAGETPGPIRGFRAHRAVADLLADPGSADITAPVDFGALAAAATQVGLEVYGPVAQRDALRALGHGVLVESLREAEAARTGPDALRIASARADAAMLVDPGGLGGLRWVALATPGLPPPAAFGA